MCTCSAVNAFLLTSCARHPCSAALFGVGHTPALARPCVSLRRGRAGVRAATDVCAGPLTMGAQWFRPQPRFAGRRVSGCRPPCLHSEMRPFSMVFGGVAVLHWFGVASAFPSSNGGRCAKARSCDPAGVYPECFVRQLRLLALHQSPHPRQREAPRTRARPLCFARVICPCWLGGPQASSALAAAG
jgi:hypothetical protein